MRGIAHFLLRVLGFVCFCLVLYPLFVAVFGFVMPNGYAPNIRYPLNSYGHQRTRMAQVDASGPVDILFLGSSHAYRGFDPRIWARHGYSSFNLGSSAQTPIQTEFIVAQQLSRLKPKLVIFEVHPGPFRDEGVESAVDMIANRPVDAYTVRMAMRLKHPYVWNALAYGAIRQMSRYDDRYVEPIRRKQDTYIDGGYVERREGHFEPVGEAKRESVDPLPIQWSAFQRALETLRARGTPYLLVEAPMTRWMNEGIFRDRARFDSLMNASGRYVNMNGKVALDDSLHFFTKGHLNQDGVVLFNEALIDTLERRGWLPER